uniref:Uncharacterized protein n=1 Tax=Anopheles atroparvus TaxID=41427 RepID=A0AAG5DJY9_ANOAO
MGFSRGLYRIVVFPILPFGLQPGRTGKSARVGLPGRRPARHRNAGPPPAIVPSLTRVRSPRSPPPAAAAAAAASPSSSSSPPGASTVVPRGLHAQADAPSRRRSARFLPGRRADGQPFRGQEGKVLRSGGGCGSRQLLRQCISFVREEPPGCVWGGSTGRCAGRAGGARDGRPRSVRWWWGLREHRTSPSAGADQLHAHGRSHQPAHPEHARAGRSAGSAGQGHATGHRGGVLPGRPGGAQPGLARGPTAGAGGHAPLHAQSPSTARHVRGAQVFPVPTRRQHRWCHAARRQQQRGQEDLRRVETVDRVFLPEANGKPSLLTSHLRDCRLRHEAR